MTVLKQKPRKKRKKRKKLSKEVRAGMGRPSIASKIEAEDLTEQERRFAELVGEGKSPQEAGALLDISRHSQRRYLKECPAIQRIVTESMDAAMRKEFIARMDKSLASFGGSPSIMVYVLDVELRLELHNYFIRQLQNDTLPAGMALQLQEAIDAKFGLVPTATKETLKTTKEITTYDLLKGLKRADGPREKGNSLEALLEPDTMKETVERTRETVN